MYCGSFTSPLPETGVMCYDVHRQYKLLVSISVYCYGTTVRYVVRRLLKRRYAAYDCSKRWIYGTVSKEWCVDTAALLPEPFSGKWSPRGCLCRWRWRTRSLPQRWWCCTWSLRWRRGHRRRLWSGPLPSQPGPTPAHTADSSLKQARGGWALKGKCRNHTYTFPQ